MFYKIEKGDSNNFILLRYEPFIDEFLVVYAGQIYLLEKGFLPTSVAEKNKLSPSWNQRAMSVPTNVQIQITNACNYKCWFCYGGSGKLNIHHLPVRKIIEVIDKLYSFGVCNVQYVGGEAFLHRDFSEIVEYTKSLGIGQSIITNGLVPGILIDKHANTLKAFNRVQVSLNGFGQEYDRQVGITIWDKFKVALKRIKEIRPDVIVSFVITFNNWTSLPKIIRLCKLYGIKFLRIGLMAPVGRNEAKANYAKYFSNLAKIREVIMKLYEEHGSLIIEDQTSHPIRHDINLKLPIDILVNPEGRDTLFISVNGSIYPFPWLETNEFYLGNIFQDNIEEIWTYNDTLKKFRSITPQNSPCNNCNPVCGLWSRSLAYLWTGSLDSKLPCSKYQFTQ